MATPTYQDWVRARGPQMAPGPMNFGGGMQTAPGPMSLGGGMQTAPGPVNLGFMTGRPPGASPNFMRGGPPGAPRATVNPNATPVGRSGLDPQRLAERAARRGNPRPLLEMFRMSQGQEFQREMADRSEGFARERDEAGRAERAQMFAAQEEQEGRRDLREWDQAKEMFGMETERRREDEAGRRSWQEERWDREREAQQFMGVENVETPDGRSYVTVGRMGDGGARVLSGSMPTRREAPEGMELVENPITGEKVPFFKGQQMPGMLRPTPGWGEAGPENRPQYERVEGTPGKPVISWQEETPGGRRVPYQQVVDPQTGEISFKQLRVDRNNDGVISPEEAEKAKQEGGVKPPPSKFLLPSATASSNG